VFLGYIHQLCPHTAKDNKLENRGKKPSNSTVRCVHPAKSRNKKNRINFVKHSIIPCVTLSLSVFIDFSFRLFPPHSSMSWSVSVPVCHIPVGHAHPPPKERHDTVCWLCDGKHQPSFTKECTQKQAKVDGKTELACPRKKENRSSTTKQKKGRNEKKKIENVFNKNEIDELREQNRDLARMT
jgi:hypothetical protein